MLTRWTSSILAIVGLIPVGRCAPAATSAATLPPGAAVVPGSERHYTIVTVDRLLNYGAKPIESPRIQMRLPIEMPQQTVTSLDIEGNVARRKDCWGAEVAMLGQSSLGPGGSMVGRWTAEATLRQFVWDLRRHCPSPYAGSASLSARDERLYLRDAKCFALCDPTVQAAAREAVRGRCDCEAKLEGIFDLVMKRIDYARDENWAAAPEVLRVGKGSCSEYTYCFVALCRANGIPARYIAGLFSKWPKGSTFFMDTVHHRTSQAFLPGLGWVDFDPTRTDKNKDQRLYFARTSQPMLFTAVGDGGEGSLTGWDYLAANTWKGDKTGVYTNSVGWWFSTPPSPEVRKKVGDFRQRLKTATTQQERLDAVAFARSIGDPFVLPWLDDLLYEPDVRAEAAKAVLAVGGQGVLHALADSLGSSSDVAGDKRIGEILAKATGQQIGADRKAWHAWLKNRGRRGNE